MFWWNVTVETFSEPEEMDQDSEITQLLKDYAENDASYEGFKLITPTTNRSDGSIEGM